MFHLLLAIIYLSFISLGLPDGLLGAGWPVMYPAFGVPVSYAGIISTIISVGTIISSLQSDRLTRRFGTGRITAVSVVMTAIALFGFSFSASFTALCLWAIPYGLGAGSVDASINNYVALHYGSHHMSWLHCMWGIGAATGPYVMGRVLAGGLEWNLGYRCIGIVQVVLSVILLLSLPLWKERTRSGSAAASRAEAGAASRAEAATSGTDTGDLAEGGAVAEQPDGRGDHALTMREILGIPGAREVITTFFCYCALESTAGLWAGSYLALYHGMDTQTAAGFASMFYVGITVGRAASGFLALKLSDTRMIRLGLCIIAAGCVTLLLPLGGGAALGGLVLLGLGCAPVYPCIIHSTPAHFGEDRSQALVGVQMASAYTGTCLMPPLFGLIAQHIHVMWFPVFLGLLLILMTAMHEKLVRKAPAQG